MYDVIVIGAGAAGLVVSNGLAAAKKKVLMIEKGLFGGDCTNYGCIPSKALIASSKVAHSVKSAKKFGLSLKDISFTADEAFIRTQQIVSSVRSHEDEKALNKKGVHTFKGVASFIDKNTIKAISASGDEKQFSAKKIVISTGSHPITPDIPGLKSTPFLNNESIFSLEKIPSSIHFLGGGPISIELALALSKLGSKVTVIQSSKHILNREDPCAREIIEHVFMQEGITICKNTSLKSVSYQNNQFELELFNKETNKSNKHISEALFIGTGRMPSLDKLQLDNGGIIHSDKGISVDSFGRTNIKSIYAIGDSIGPPFFTHLAETHGRVVLQNLILPFKTKIPKGPYPRVTFTEPEIASFGFNERDAIEKYSEKKLQIYHFSLCDLDRAITDSSEEGFVKVITKKWSSKIIGATIVAPRAGEMIQELILAKESNITFRKLKNQIHPYPTYSRAIRQTSDLYLKDVILKTLSKWLP